MLLVREYGPRVKRRDSRAIQSMYRRIVLTLLICFNVEAAPLPTHDQNPFLAGFGLPRTIAPHLPARSAWMLDLNWSSIALEQRSGSEELIADAETRELRLTYTQRLSERWALALELPYRETSGGSLDSFIDSWHDIFGLPGGARSMQPRDRLQLYYGSAGKAWIERARPRRGLADASLSAIYALFASPSSAISAALRIKLPTGTDHWLNSSDAVDVSAILAAERKLGERYRLEAQLAATRLGAGELLPWLQRELVWSGRAGLTVRATRALELVLQLDGHTRVFDSDLEFFREALIATLGGHLHFGEGWTFSAGVSEDLLVEHSPDVVFVLALSRRL